MACRVSSTLNQQKPSYNTHTPIVSHIHSTTSMYVLTLCQVRKSYFILVCLFLCLSFQFAGLVPSHQPFFLMIKYMTECTSVLVNKI